MHHIVGDAASAIARFQTPGVQVSAQYVIGSDGTLYQCVAEGDVAYCDGSAESNAMTISIEHAGGLPSVPYTDAMYDTSIKLVRDLIARYGITDFKRHHDVIDKHAYPGGTECPGALDVERIVNAAKGEEMTTLNATSLRILELCLNNWPADTALSGANDQKFLDAEGWKDPNDVVYSMFISNGPWIKKIMALQTGVGDDEAEKILDQVRDLVNKEQAQ